MAINKNHEFEDLNGIKCAIVEKNASQQRADFLKDLLEFNNYKVVIVASPPPDPSLPPAPTTFTVGVTDVSFNPTNAIFGRLIQTKEGNVVTLAYWQQKEAIAKDDVPYFESTAL